MFSLKLISATILLLGGLYAQNSASTMLKTLPLASDATRVTLLRYLAEKGSGEAYETFTYFLGYGRSTAMVNPKPTDPDYTADLREIAAVGLGNIKDKKATPLLIHALKDDDNRIVLRSIAHALGQIADPTAIPYLMKQLQASSDQKLVFEITWALSQFKDDAVMGSMIDIMKGPYVPSAKIIAKQTLKDMGWPENIGY